MPERKKTKWSKHPKGKLTGKTPEARERQRLALVKANQVRWKKKVTVNPGSVKNKRYDLKTMDIIEFVKLLGLTLYPNQELLLRRQYGLSVPQRLLKSKKSKRASQTKEKLEGVWCLGARSGKSFMASIIALYETLCRGHIWRERLRTNESGYCIIVSTSLDQSKDIIQKNCTDIILNSVLHTHVDGTPLTTELKFINGLIIKSIPCNSRVGRGVPVFCFILDEVAHFFGEGYVKADVDIHNSITPRMSQFRDPKKILISTPAAKQGLFFDLYNEGFKIKERLTVRGGTLAMNPHISKKFLKKEKERDIDNFNREYNAIFAETKSSYFTYDDIIRGLVIAGNVKPKEGVVYECGIDQSGLSGRDRFSLAISHREDDVSLVDFTRSWQTKDQDRIMSEIKVLKELYGFTSVSIDRYAGGWVKGALQKIGLVVEFREALPIIYSNFKSLLIATRLRLPDNLELKRGLIQTIAYYSKSNALSITHPRNKFGHSDLTDAVVTAIYLTSKKPNRPKRKTQRIHYDGPGTFYVEPTIAAKKKKSSIKFIFEKVT